MNASVATAADSMGTIVVRRTINASPEDLFDAWLDPVALATWMRPGTVRTTTATVDACIGGRYEIIMTGESAVFPHRGVYRTIDRPRRLVFTWESPPTEHRETLVTVDFLPRGELTEVVVTHEQLPPSAMPSHTNGWTGALERLSGCYP